MSQPIAVGTNGTYRAWFVPVIADPTAPKLTEINAAGSLDISFYLTGGGYNPDVSENTVNDERLASKQIFEARGDFTKSLELEYTFNPKAPTSDQARIKLAEGAKGFIVVRPAVDSEDAAVVGDLVDVTPVDMGVQRRLAKGRNQVHTITQKAFITGTVHELVAVVA